jgi:ABC-type branched-subunit amino acid transport system ATPase component
MLRLQSVSKAFGALQAVNDVSFELADEGITGLVGPNGSGKSTLFHLITGFYRLDRGQIFFNDRSIERLPPHRISRLGLIRTFQHTRVLPLLSVLENLIVAAPAQVGENIWSIFFNRKQVRSQEGELKKQALEILELLALKRHTGELAGRLSYGQQKLLELGRVLMADPRWVLLDEPTAGINPSLIRQLVDVLQRVVERGIQIFLIEHNMPLVAELCRRVLVMDSGELIFSGPAAAARTDPRVIEAYLGRETDAA